MSKNTVVIAADIGTTSAKALAVGLDGCVRAVHAKGYPLLSPEPDAAEQDPDVIADAVFECVREAVRKSGAAPDDVLCVSFGAAMHSLIALDAGNRPLTRSITWADRRAQAFADELNADGTGLSVYRRTGTPIHPMSPLVKLRWLRRERPDVFRRAAKFVGIKEYIFHLLFGRYVVDYSIASTTGMFNLQQCGWDAEAMELAGVQPHRLPEPLPATSVLSGISEADASRLGLRPDTPFVIGASDGALANLGAGVMGSDRLAVTVGTSGAVRKTVDRPVLDERGRLFCYALAENRWVIGGATNNGAIVLQWMRDQLYAQRDQAGTEREEAFDRMLEEAEAAGCGAGGLLFLPLLAGERAPFWNGSARGVFFGLSLRHERKHMVRAAMEGVMFQIAAIASLLEAPEAGGKPAEALAGGGFAKSPLWCQILADMLGIPVAIPDTVESSGLGAARLGMYAVGAVNALEHDWGQSAPLRYEPDGERHGTYRELFGMYMRLYEQVKELFPPISRFQRNE